jgi:ethanolamine ammonia-lyase large subunit
MDRIVAISFCSGIVFATAIAGIVINAKQDRIDELEINLSKLKRRSRTLVNTAQAMVDTLTPAQVIAIHQKLKTDIEFEKIADQF